MAQPAQLMPLADLEMSVTVITPSHGWVVLQLVKVWAYRELLYFLTWRDIKVCYKQTILGAAWAVIQPFMAMVVFSIFFGRPAQIPSMAFSIESRVPFLTPALVTYIFSLPEGYLITPDGTTKAVFRKAMRGIIPSAILDCKDKIGFATPEKDRLFALRPWGGEYWQVRLLKKSRSLT